jgi:hypothetical protein
MKRRPLVVGLVVVAAGVWGGCFSSSPNQPVPDASTGADGGSSASDASMPPPDAGTLPDGSVAEAASDATTPATDATLDSSPADATQPVEAAVDAGAGGDAGADGGVEAATEAGGGTVTSTASLHLGSARQEHSATLLANGHVLLCGGWYGYNGSWATCDNFDPTTDTMSPATSMLIGRRDHSATLLPSGQVLVAGGSGTNDAGAFGVMRTAEIFDPVANTFTLVSNLMAQARSGPAVLLTSGANAGKVALVGGYGDGTVYSGPGNDTSLNSAEVFDPGADATHGTFTLLGFHMSVRRSSLTAAGLPEGGLLAAGGSYVADGGMGVYLDTAETLDPAFTTFAGTANNMSAQRQGAQSVTLPDGRIFVFNGVGSTGNSATGDIYDPATRTFTATAPLGLARNYAAVAALHSGRVMIAGGNGAGGTYGDIIVYDPATNTYSQATGTINPPRTLATATTLNDGRVLIAGGQTATGPITTAVDLFTE